METKIKRIIINSLIVICWGLMMFFSLFSTFSFFYDSENDGKWYGSIFFSLLFLFIYNSIYIRHKTWFLLEAIVITSCTLLALVGTSHFDGLLLPNNVSAIAGFDNISGYSSALVFSIPFGINCFSQSTKKWSKILFFIEISICIFFVFAVRSRTGILCITMLICISLYKKIRYKSIFLVMPTILFLLVTWKAKSTEGRWFIINRTIDIINAHPLVGLGYNGFECNYMNFQGSYFKAHPISHYSSIAGNIHHPLNEYLYIAVNYGIPCLTILILAIITIIRLYLKSNNQKSFQSFILFILIICYSFFSYPFHYPFTWIALAYSLGDMFTPYLRKRWKKNRYLTFVLLIPLVITLQKAAKSIEWGMASKIPKTLGNKKEILQKYQLMESQLNSSAFFYDYSLTLYYIEDFELAHKYAKKCADNYADYDVQILLGSIAEKLGNYSEAKRYYLNAHFMCPSRESPLLYIQEMPK